MNKLKTIIGMLAVAGAMTGFAATDAELKAMLDAKDYKSFAFQADNVQLTNLLTEATAREVVDVYAKTNTCWKSDLIAKSKMLDYVDIVNIYVANKNSQAMIFANASKNDDVIVDTWSKVVNMPEADIKNIYTHTCHKFKLKSDNLELTKKTAERILNECPKVYTVFVFLYDSSKVSDEFKAWAKECVKNINVNTCDLRGWYQLNWRGYGKTSEFYFEDMWKIKKLSYCYLIYQLSKTEYYNQAIEVLANNLQDPKTTYEWFALEVDKRAKNKEMTKRMFPVIAKDIHYSMQAALYLNDADKVIDILLVAKEEFSAEEINRVIPMINSLEIDYRKNDIIKALRNINGRYTLKLYDDRETWEPILSKIRALIDVRQM